MDNYSEETLDKELEKIAKELGVFGKAKADIISAKPIGLNVVLNAHKLLKNNELWKLLPKKGKLKGKR